MRTPFRKLLSRCYRWPIGLMVPLLFCAILLPMPGSLRPSDGVEKDLSQPFPCQNRPCGCRSAEQCWKKCCCFTNSQKVAWAKANKVELPDYVLTAARKETATAKKPCALCSKNSEKGTSLKCGESTLSSSRKPKTHAARSPNALTRTRTSKWVLSVYAAECQGQPSFSMCFPATIIPDRVTPVTVSVQMTELLRDTSERLNSTSLRPPLPPPKIV